VIIVNYGDPALVDGNVASEIDADDGVLIVLVDNFSSNRARSAAEKLCQDRGWLFVPSANDGFAAGVNRGARAARPLGHDVFITINPDAQASAHVLQALAEHVSADPRTLVSPFIDTSEGKAHFRGGQMNRHTGRMRSGWSEHDTDTEWANWLSGACLAFSATAFDELGGLDERFFLYWEDVDFSRRAAEHGMHLDLRPDLLAVHDEGGTQDAGSARTKSPTYYFYNIRNRLLFARLHLHRRDLVTWLLTSPRESAMIWMRGGRRQLLTEPRGALAAVRGAFAGLALLPTTRPGPRLVRPTSSTPEPLRCPETVRITIAIPSFRRPQRLAALLAALPERIAETTGADIDVLVVDNDPEGSARTTVENAALEVRYAHETTPGISAARNRALDECASSDLLAFLDDDEIPRQGWLSHLVRTWRAHSASAVAGRLISVFEEGTDPWILASGTFYRRQRPTGSSMSTASTANLLLDMREVQRLGLQFDTSLGLSGGEDTMFTRDLVRRGGTIFWCNESEVEDTVVPDRLTREWAEQRAFSAGNGSVQVALRLADNGMKRLALRAKFTASGGLRIAAGAARRQLGRSQGDIEHHAQGTRTLHRGRGMLAGARGHLYEEYGRR
jgi:GT2 family glycosyltransferase